MNRRRFLGISLRLPAALAALPLIGGIAGAVEQAEPEAQQTAETVYDYCIIGWDEGGFLIQRFVGGVYQGYDRPGLALRSILVRYGNVVTRLVAPWERGLPMVAS